MLLTPGGDTVRIAFRRAGDERYYTQMPGGQPALVQGRRVVCRLRRDAVGQRPEPDAGRRPTGGPRLLRAAHAQQGDPPGQPGGAIRAAGRAAGLRQTHVGARRVH